jgi:hypothetical protein
MARMEQGRQSAGSKEMIRMKNADCAKPGEDPWANWKPLGFPVLKEQAKQSQRYLMCSVEDG